MLIALGHWLLRWRWRRDRCVQWLRGCEGDADGKRTKLDSRASERGERPLPEAVGINRGQGFRLSKTSQSQLSTRDFPHGAWSFSEWPQVHIPSLPILSLQLGSSLRPAPPVPNVHRAEYSSCDELDRPLGSRRLGAHHAAGSSRS